LNILICPDKFKGSLNAQGVCTAISAGLLSIDPNVTIQSVPLADGGEGTCDLLTEWNEGTQIEVEVHGPLFAPVTAHYGISGDGNTAFIEMAVASGLMLLEPHQRNPLVTTTLGTGEMIVDALRRNVKKIIMGLGGSATNDAGIGMASAFGYEFCDAEGEALKPTGENLIHMRQIKMTGVNPLAGNARVVALCDVTNPLYGPAGAAFVYGPQKGADDQAVKLLDAGLRNFRRIVHKYLKTSVDFPGAGAAGGLGAGARVFLQATIEKGVNYIMQNTRIVEKINKADLVITGEGRIDQQTFSGKVVSEVISLARKAGKPVIAVCGKCDISREETQAHGLLKVISLVDAQTSPESAVHDASAHITRKIIQNCQHLLKL
jgi:glycerate 2-kinase